MTVVTPEQLQRCGRVWDSATATKRVALVVLAFGYLPAFNMLELPWAEIGQTNQRDMARGVAELCELIRQAGKGDGKTAQVTGGTGAGPDEGDPGAPGG